MLTRSFIWKLNGFGSYLLKKLFQFRKKNASIHAPFFIILTQSNELKTECRLQEGAMKRDEQRRRIFSACSPIEKEEKGHLGERELRNVHTWYNVFLKTSNLTTKREFKKKMDDSKENVL